MKTLIFLLVISLVAASILVISDISTTQACTPYENCEKIPIVVQTAHFNGKNQSYSIPYTMTNGNLVASLVDIPAKELLFNFNATSNGKLIVQLPRQIIDSTRDGIDKPYLVFVGTWDTDPKRVKANEIQNDNKTRTLEVDFAKNDNHIGIVGTYLIENNSTSAGKNVFGAWSPLQQYNKGFDAQDIVCRKDLQLVIKAEDQTPACVKPDTAQKLIERGWASSLRKENMIYDTSCNTPYLRSDSNITVLYMPTNSIGKICVRYYNLNNTPVGIGIRIFEENNMTQNVQGITTWASKNTLQGNENTTVSYFINTGSKAGFYGLSLFCGGMPFAVGYDANSTLVASDFSNLLRVIHCPAQTYEYDIEGVEGIGIRYISNPPNLPQ